MEFNAADVQPGDIITLPFGIRREPEQVTVHSVHRYDTGDLSIRFRYTENPRGVDWSGFIAADESELRLDARGVARIDTNTRSMMSGWST